MVLKEPYFWVGPITLRPLVEGISLSNLAGGAIEDFQTCCRCDPERSIRLFKGGSQGVAAQTGWVTGLAPKALDLARSWIDAIQPVTRRQPNGALAILADAIDRQVGTVRPIQVSK